MQAESAYLFRRRDSRVHSSSGLVTGPIVPREPAGGVSLLERRIERLLPALFFLGLAAVMVAPFFMRDSWMVFVQDDLLYYLQVAKNIAQGHGSTFNGIVPTNGYQPLWLLLLVPLSRFTEDPRSILGFVAVSNFVSAIATFLLARRLLRTSGVRPLLVFVLAAWTTLYSVTLFLLWHGSDPYRSHHAWSAVPSAQRRLA